MKSELLHILILIPYPRNLKGGIFKTGNITGIVPCV